MLKAIQLGLTAFAAVFSVGTIVLAQEAPVELSQGTLLESAAEDYCGNMGTVKTIAFDQIVIDGMNWDFESDDETVEETYVVDPGVKPELDGYTAYTDIKEGDFIGIECQKKNGKMIATLIQSEEAINQAFEDASEEDMDIEEPMGQVKNDVMQVVEPEIAPPSAEAIEVK